MKERQRPFIDAKLREQEREALRIVKKQDTRLREELPITKIKQFNVKKKKRKMCLFLIHIHHQWKYNIFLLISNQPILSNYSSQLQSTNF